MQEGHEGGRGQPAQSRGSARRRRTPGRVHQVNIAFTDEEYQPIAARAAAGRVSVARYGAACMIAGPRPPEVPPLLVSELVVLRRIAAGEAGNLNQIARAVNAGYQRDAALPDTARAVRESWAGIDALLARIGVPAQRNATPHRRSDPEEQRSDPEERRNDPAGRRNNDPGRRNDPLGRGAGPA